MYRLKMALVLFLLFVILFQISVLFKNKKIQQVNLTKKGFVPEELTINKGETVVFSTQLGKYFWPASNIHPQHNIYPEFDPKKSLKPNEKWTFTFTKEGEWGYHDHLFASYTGVIKVNGPGAKKTYNLKACEAVEDSEKQNCWDRLLGKTVKESGLDSAFDLFVKLYTTDPDIPKACHGWSHVLGKAAYELFARKKDFVLRRETSYCGYGFFHGFIEKLISDTGDVKKTKDFCDYASEKLKGKAGGVYHNCIHGIGHGAGAVAAENPVNSGEFQTMVDYGVSVCEKTLGDKPEIRECFDGVFNALQQYLYHSEYGLNWSKFKDLNDPFYHCQRQKENLKVSCFYEFIGLFEDIFQKDFQKAAVFVAENIPDQQHARIGIRKLAADNIQSDIVNPSQEDNVIVCRNLPAYLSEPCFSGIVSGFMAHGEPEKEYIKGLAFCDSKYLTTDEINSCYSEMFGQFKSTYSEENFRKACNIANNKKTAEFCS